MPLAVGLTIGLADTLRGRAYSAEHITIEGVGNAGRVNDHLYRGGQPSTEGLQALKALGVQTVVSFTLGSDDDVAVNKERDDVEALGMRFVHLPWSTTQIPPSEHIAAFLDLLRSSPNETVFVHCKAGVDRTGVMVASYRVAVDHWPADRAMAEMNAFRFHWIFFPHLARYVGNLPTTLAQMP